MTIEERVRELHQKAARDLVDAHRMRTDEPLVLAARFDLDDPEDVHLLEALQGFPGGDEDEPLVTDFDPSPQLRILGKLHLALASPAQIRAAVARGDALIGRVRKGAEVLYDDGSQAAQELRGLLGL